jgi:hypothetical protein
MVKMSMLIYLVIRKYGYFGTTATMKAMEENENCSIPVSLSAVAHLIHGSTEGRFNLTILSRTFNTGMSIIQ